MLFILVPVWQDYHDYRIDSLLPNACRDAHTVGQHERVQDAAQYMAQ